MLEKLRADVRRAARVAGASEAARAAFWHAAVPAGGLASGARHPPAARRARDTPRDLVLLEGTRGSSHDLAPPPPTRRPGRASHRPATQPPGTILPQPTTAPPPPWAPPPPAVLGTPPPPGRRLADGPVRTAVQHRGRGGCPTHAVMQRMARAGGAPTHGCGERVATTAGTRTRVSTTPQRPAWRARVGPRRRAHGAVRRNPNSSGQFRTTLSCSAFVRVFVWRANAGHSTILVQKSGNPPTAIRQRGACPGLSESRKAQPPRLEADCHDSPRT